MRDKYKPASPNSSKHLRQGDRLLQNNPDLTQRQFAEKLGLSVVGSNNCFKALMVKMQNFQNSNFNFKFLYIRTSQDIAEKVVLTSHFL